MHSEASVGVGGRPETCSRAYNLVLLHFELPRVAPSAVRSVALSLNVTQVVGGGVDAVLYGLGQRGATEAEAMSRQTAADFYAGVDDAAANATLISRSFIPADSIAGVPTRVEHRSEQLRAYIASQLASGGGGRYVSLRVSGSSFLGGEEQRLLRTKRWTARFSVPERCLGRDTPRNARARAQRR